MQPNEDDHENERNGTREERMIVMEEDTKDDMEGEPHVYVLQGVRLSSHHFILNQVSMLFLFYAY